MKREATRPVSRDRAFTHTLCQMAATGRSGIVTATSGKLRRLFCVDRGALVFVASNLVEEQFSEYLARREVVPGAALAAAAEEATRTGKKIPEVLVDSGQVGVDALKLAMTRLIQELFSSSLEWPDGTTSAEVGTPRLEGEIVARVDPRSLVLAHVKRYPASVDALRIRIGPPDFRPVAAETLPDGLEVGRLGDYLLARADGETELAAIVAGSPEGEEPTLRMIYGLLLIDMLQPEDAESRQARLSFGKEGPLTRDECLGRLAMVAAQDHYGVLGVERTARRERIRDAYYALARRYHPDRFRSGGLSDLLPRFEEFFTRVTESYNTLIDPEHRREYDASLTGPAAEAAAASRDTGYLARQNFLRGRALAGQRKFSEAVGFLENAVQLDPSQAEYRLELGIVLSSNPRRRDEAERHLLQAVTMAPALVAGYVTLGKMYLRSARKGRAARMAREALRWEPGHAEATALLADAGDAVDESDDGGFRPVFSSSS